MANTDNEDQIKNMVVTESLIKKLDSISYDIKTYMNMNYGIARSMPENAFPRMEQKDVDELIGIRKSIKKLSRRLTEAIALQPKE